MRVRIRIPRLWRRKEKIDMLETTKTLSIMDIYGETLENLQQRLVGRQEFTAFEMVPPQPVQFLTLDGRIKTNDPTRENKHGGPRLIVTERRLRKFVYTETGEKRGAGTDEWYLTANDTAVAGPSAEPVRIVTRELQEV